MQKTCRRFVLLGMTALLLFLISSEAKARNTCDWKEAALFCWTESVLFEEEEQKKLFQVMEEHQIGSLFQSIPRDAGDESLVCFLDEAAKRNIQVWLLTGDPSWGLDPEGTKMIRAVSRAADYCDRLGTEPGFYGVVMDCEPYTLEAWQKDAQAVMNSWVSAAKASCRYAAEHGLSFILCVPYYLDEEGFSSQLEELLQSGCDGLLVMNYFKKGEAEHIENEAAMAKTAGKPLIIAYELQAPGSYGLTEHNTYYHDGLAAVRESWSALTARYGQTNFQLALHEYEALCELHRRKVQ